MRADKNTSRRLFNLDGVLREDAAARANPSATNPSAWRFEGHLGKGGQGSVTKWSRRRPGSSVRGNQ
jgi:hypothetical protein